MLVHTGLDAVELARIQKSMESPSFAKYILGEQEYAYYKEKGFPVESVASTTTAA